MQQYLKKALFASILIYVTTSSYGQYYKRNKFLEGFKIQPKVGFNMFYGDLVSEKRTKYTIGIAAEKELSTYLNARADLSYGSMQGTQINEIDGGTYATFDNSYIHFNIGATFRPFDLAYGLFKQRRVNPYIIGQIGIMPFSATEYWGNSGKGEEGTIWREVSEMAPTVSIGGGASIFLNSRVSINVEFIPSYSFNDRLDAHDVWYRGEITAPKTPENTVQTDGNDFFYVGTIGVSYLFDDSKWKNSPKYNRKAYLRTRSLYKVSKKKIKRPKRPKRRRY